MRKKKSTKDLRVFLGFSQPPLVSAAEWLVRQYRVGSEIDLGNHLLVLPSKRAVLRLLQLLVQQAEENSAALVPPKLVTIGDFPEHLYPVEKKLATDLCQQIAWSKALQESPEEEIQNLFPGSPRTELEQWQPYAKLILELHRRLGNDVWSFSSVVREVQSVKEFREHDRWEALKAIQKRYYGLLTEVDLWDKQAARNVAVRQELCTTDKQIIMIGAADLNRATKKMLGQVRDKVRVLVAAPRNLEDRFDDFGGLITETWLNSDIKFSCDRLQIVDRADDQAFAVAHYLSELGDKFSADQITIGVPDGEVQPQIERSLKAIGVQHRDLKGQPIKETSPVKLLLAMKEFVDEKSFASFAALVRHPDIFHWIAEQVETRSWLAYLDGIQSTSLFDRMDIGAEKPFGEPAAIAKKFASRPSVAERESKKVRILNQVFGLVSELFEEVTGEPRSIAKWTAPWCEILDTIYGQRVLSKTDFTDLRTLEACREMYRALHDMQQVPADWQTATTSARALQMAIDAASDWNVVSPPQVESVEMSGWLDLPLDDAAVLVVTGMNDEHVPASENGHLFLPNKLCTTLGIVDNDRRYARDAYALTVINSVRDHVLLIAGRRDLQGEPKKPSRLLFADENTIVAKRANAFFAYDGKSASRYWLADPAQAAIRQQFVIPRPADVPTLEELPVTGFRNFIKCPYRFYLGTVLKLEQAVDNLQEMDGRSFGNLAHEVLEEFGLSEYRDSTSETEITKYLDECLNAHVRRMYRGARLPAVRVQVEQLRLRLRAFATLQAEKAREGWTIVSVEENNKHPLIVDGQEFRLSGTIDRVDIHEATGRVAIWDYKSSDVGEPANKVHLDRNGWKDLQLPLYRHLVKEIKAVKDYDLSDVQLGYVLLPKSIDKVGFDVLDCSPQELSRADDLLKDIIRKIRRGKYWPPEKKPPRFSEAFAGICQDRVFERYNIDAEASQEEVTA